MPAPIFIAFALSGPNEGRGKLGGIIGNARPEGRANGMFVLLAAHGLGEGARLVLD